MHMLLGLGLVLFYFPLELQPGALSLSQKASPSSQGTQPSSLGAPDLTSDDEAPHSLLHYINYHEIHI